VSKYEVLARRLISALQPPMPPVAVTFADSIPGDVSPFTEVVPAGCSFWQEATTRTFATSTGDHELCAIGVHTHNLDGALSSQPVELTSTLGAMMGLDYVREEEVAGIPTMQDSHKHVIYGPLDEVPDDRIIDAVLVFAHSRQGLIITESVTRVDGTMPPAMGRPACSVIPMVINQEAAAMSLGCCGARAYLDKFSDGIALWALPGRKIAEYCQAIETMAGANATLTTFHSKRGDDIAAGNRPTVEESLGAL